MEHNPPPFFKRGPAPRVRLLLCTLISIALLISDARYGYLENVRKIVSVLVYPLQRLAGAPRSLLDSMGEFFVTQNALRSENAKLAAQSLNDALILRKHAALATCSGRASDSRKAPPSPKCSTPGAICSREKS
jgi:rod shape-determining protein MreC